MGLFEVKHEKQSNQMTRSLVPSIWKVIDRDRDPITYVQSASIRPIEFITSEFYRVVKQNLKNRFKT